MKKLLYLLFLFISCNEVVYGQVTIAYSSSDQTASPGAVTTITSRTFTAGKTYIFLIGSYAASTPSDNPTISSGGLTLLKKGTVAGDFNDRLIAYTATVGASDVTTAITFTYGESQNTKVTAIYETTGTGLAMNVVGESDVTANPTLTLPAGTGSTIVFALNNQNPFGGTAEAGWTEDADAGNSVPVGRYFMHRNNTTDNTPIITASASNWTAIGLQVLRSRRMSIIN